MRYNKIFSALAAVLMLGFGAASCSDTWDDHYAAQQQGSGVSLWATISAKPELSNFAKVLQATGYDKALASTQVFTVFAPTNDKFTDADVQAVLDEYNADLAKGLKGDKNSGIKEFVQNHIALYNYSSAPELLTQSLRMMNGKFIQFNNDTFDGISYLSKNEVAGNGILYTLSDKASYAFNLYEYIKKDSDLDSVATFLSHYDFEEFKASESVPGEIIDGQQHYLDSVTVSTNEILERWLDVLLESEDSSYYALCPTNEAWKKQLERNQQLFTYDNTVALKDSFEYIYPRVFILAGAQFSQTQNKKLGQTQEIDSIMSPQALPYSLRKLVYGSYDKKYYQYDKPYAAGGIFDGAIARECSNGVLLKNANWNISPYQTFIQDIVMEAEGRNTLDSLSGATREAKPNWTRRRVPNSNPYYDNGIRPLTEVVSGNEFYTLQSTNATMPGVLLDFTDVLANQEYDMYVVCPPSTANDTLSTDTLPTCFKATVFWNDIEGVQQKLVIDNESCQNSDVQTEDGDVAYDAANSTRRESIYDFQVDPTRIHQIKIGTFKFPTCSYNLSQPQIKVYLEVCVTNANVLAGKYSKNLNIDAIKLVPRADR